MKKKVQKILTKILSITSATALIFGLVLGTIFIIYYSKGYRFSLKEDTVELSKTGVLSITSYPSRADLYIDGEKVGKTPRTEGSIPEGSYSVSVKKEAYKDWTKVLPVKAELSTPYIANLFLEKPLANTDFKMKQDVISAKISGNENHIFLLTRQDPSEIEP